jgi:hypothetical protein
MASIPGLLTFDLKKKLLVVRSVAEAKLASDGRGVLIRMIPQDAMVFAGLTAKFTGGYLILTGGKDVIEFCPITGKIDDGYLGFRYPEEKLAADYLRKRLFPNPL